MAEREILPGNPLTELSGMFRSLLAFAAGAATVLAFAPFSLHPLAIVAPGVLFLLWLHAAPGQAFREGWLFGLGLLGFGVFWLHISIDQFGNVGTGLAVLITLAFVSALALLYGAPGWLMAKLVRSGAPAGRLLMAFCSLWVLSEWVRGWIFTGFPWLVLGYSQIDAPLAGWADILGVYGVSMSVAVSAGLLCLLAFGGRPRRKAALAGLLTVWGAGAMLPVFDWTAPAGKPIRVSIIQGNIPQQEKWQREMLVPTLELYAGLTRKHWQSDLIIWPETAVPAFVDQVDKEFLQPIRREAREQGSTLLLGIADLQPGGRYYNAMIALGEVRESYHKRHLVPFGEFMPLNPLLSPLIEWLAIPMSDFSAGQGERPLLTLAGYPAGISICYEDAFGEEVIEALPEAAFLVNASNDAWFGDSLAPHQHLQIARMRALESGRYLLRATNTGISAIIEPDGALQNTSPAFERDVLSGVITPLSGVTPYARWGNWPAVTLAFLLLMICCRALCCRQYLR